MQNQAPSHDEILQQQVFCESSPGTILADFRILLEFFENSIKTEGKNHRIPLAALNVLDERTSNPLRPNMQRPQQMGYPHLNGLFLLARSSGILVSRGQGATGLLAIDPERRSQWRSLNPTEQYLTLFQTMMTADWGPIDSQRSSSVGPWQEINSMWRYWTLVGAREVKGGNPASKALLDWTSQTTAALLELFGILEIPRIKQKQGENWRVGPVKTTAFGAAFMARLLAPDQILRVHHIVHPMRFTMNPEWVGDLFRDVFPGCRQTFSKKEEAATTTWVSAGGVWQFKLSMGTKIWRRIQIQSELTIESLVDVILETFEFEDTDHLYEFSFKSSSGQNLTIGHPTLDEADNFADDFKIGNLPLDPGMSMKFHFDFGADWRFDVKLEKCLAPDVTLDHWRLIESKGDAPEQYPEDEDDGW